jgi:hypothetical protein
MLRRWDLPESPWALHSVPLLGNLTDRWIDTQAESHERYGSRLLGMDVAAGAERAPHWLVARDRRDLWLAYKARVKSLGLSPLWFLPQLRPWCTPTTGRWESSSSTSPADCAAAS